MHNFYYKYLAPERIENFSKEDGTFSLWAQTPMNFNDPFECAFSTEQLFSDAGIACMKSNMRERVQELFNLNCDKNKKIKKSVLYKAEKEEIQKLKNDPIHREKEKQKFIKGWEDTLKNQCKVISLSRTHNNLLMWAHYAKEHKGFVVKFDFKDLGVSLRKKIKTEIRNVIYSDKLIELQHKSVSFDFSGEILCTKSKDWEYEQETRILIASEGMHPNNAFININSLVINEIFLGLRMEEKDKKKICDICRNNEAFKHIKIMQAKRSMTKYELDFEEVILPFRD